MRGSSRSNVRTSAKVSYQEQEAERFASTTLKVIEAFEEEVRTRQRTHVMNRWMKSREELLTRNSAVHLCV